MLENAQDLYVEKVGVSGDGVLSLRTALFDESEILAAQAARHDGGRECQAGPAGEVRAGAAGGSFRPMGTWPAARYRRPGIRSRSRCLGPF